MNLKLHPLRQNVLHVQSANKSTEISINNNPQGDGIMISLMGGKHFKGNGETFNKIRIVENDKGLIDAHVFPKGVVIPELGRDEKIIWSNF